MHKIKIIKSIYIENSDLIRWDVVFLDNQDEQVYVWPSVDLFSALGIKEKIDKNLINKFCKDMCGKELNFVVDRHAKSNNIEMSQDEYKSATKSVEKYFDDFIKYMTEA
jgi:hypothetical protein